MRLGAYILSDNRLAEKAGWDPNILATELQHLLTIEVADFDVTVTGFEVGEIDLILEEANRKPDIDDVLAAPDTGPAVTSRLFDEIAEAFGGEPWLITPSATVNLPRAANL
jgi:hypothetical protein